MESKTFLTVKTREETNMKQSSKKNLHLYITFKNGYSKKIPLQKQLSKCISCH